MITVKSPAKINLFLDILGKIENGYHSLFMVMQSVDLFEIVSVDKTEEDGIFLTCSDPRLPQDEKNIAWKAAAAFFSKTKITPSCRIDIEKHIPFAAGLAGGSADAAAVIVALNKLYETNLDTEALCEIGLTVGSDVPFCIMGGTCLSQNRGEILSKLKPLKDCFIVLAKPECGVSTAEAYAAADSADLRHPDKLHMLEACANGDFEGICKYAGNVFEQVIEVVERVEIKSTMRNHNASLYQMSGSGPTVFGLFKNVEDAENCARELKNICNDVYVTKPVNHGAQII